MTAGFTLMEFLVALSLGLLLLYAVVDTFQIIRLNSQRQQQMRQIYFSANSLYHILNSDIQKAQEVMLPERSNILFKLKLPDTAVIYRYDAAQGQLYRQVLSFSPHEPSGILSHIQSLEIYYGMMLHGSLQFVTNITAKNVKQIKAIKTTVVFYSGKLTKKLTMVFAL